jgi:cytochrome c biogenesis protein CcdA/glutaredoxin
MKMLRIMLLVSASLCLVAAAVFAADEGRLPRLVVFHSPSCHSCQEAKAVLIPVIEKEFEGKINIEYRDITLKDDYLYFLSLQKKYGRENLQGLPVFFFNGQFLENKGEVRRNLSGLISSSLALGIREDGVTLVDLAGIFKSFRPAVIIGAGLVDGINPCAFTVIVFFMSFLALQGYRKRELAVIGLTFIFAVFFTYLLIGLGVFQFLYRLQSFWLATRIVNYSVGAFSIILGGFAFYDFVRYKRTGSAEGLLLQLPGPIKNRIHAVIGRHYRKPDEKRRLAGLAVSALVTGFLVSLLEAVCTGQTYLPTIVFIFKGYNDLKAFFYLIIYNLMFVAPLFVIFLLALFGATSQQFSRFMKEKLGFIKMMMCFLFLGLGAYLIWRG